MKTTLLFFFALCASSIFAQNNNHFDPFELNQEHYQSNEIKNGESFMEGGIEYRIIKTAQKHGLEIKSDEVWRKQGKFYYYNSDGKLKGENAWLYGAKSGKETMYYENGNTNKTIKAVKKVFFSGIPPFIMIMVT